MFHQRNKSENFTPGFICVLHTFGRDLKWNPHIHVLLSEGGAGNKTVWRGVNYFNYTLLRNSFRTALLNHMEEHIGMSFKKVKAYIYKNCPNGFYVYAKPAPRSNTNEIIKYIGRYLGRPIIATFQNDSILRHLRKETQAIQRPFHGYLKRKETIPRVPQHLEIVPFIVIQL